MNGQNGTLLVTGGAGYIGSHFVALLADRGVPYIVVDNLSRSSGEFVQQDKLVKADVGDTEAIAETVRKYGVTGAVHFAAFAAVGESVVDPGLYYENNVVQTCQLVTALRDAGVRHMVFSSTCATYGIPPEGKHLSESMEQNPINPYGRSKLMIEQLMRDYHAAYGMSFALLRYFNAAGCSPAHPLYERHEPETHAIPLALRAAMGGKEFVIFGDDFNTPDGTCIRDYIHVDDLAEAHMLALHRLYAEPGVLALNLGTGRGTSVRELLESVRRVTGVPVPHRVGPRREGDPPVLVADAQLAQTQLGWKPNYLEIDDIIRTAHQGELRASEALAATNR
ncbi:MAG TPA: UDP-glucose 4-epimerase GalE [Candidatus Baltobacteraceae bacterium]|jgi:UDP-glucose-4-epimerase GalE|nr:UDP-glucose 4-epimerase GalE [Candidatus Baltobacteraceae bacterium]